MASSYLTVEGFQKLHDELDYLRKEKRQAVAARLHEAMEGGELIEDAEYEDGNHEVIQIGARITIQEEGGEPEDYIIVGPAEADPRNGKISNESPIGKALMDHRQGDQVNVNAPGGSFVVTVLKVK